MSANSDLGIKFVIKVIDYTKYKAEKKAIDTVCNTVQNDYAIVQIASAAVLRNQPRAQKMLEYYISGKGKTMNVHISIEELFADDQAVKKHVIETIKSQRKILLMDKGIVPVPQSKFSNPEWKNTTGSININWRVENNKIIVNFVNLYRWHPTEERVSQCVHQAAENLKTSGAAEFWMIGDDYTLPDDIMGSLNKIRLR